MKVLCYGVRAVEKPFFIEINKKFGYELVLTEQFLTDESVHLSKGCEAVILRGNCPANKKNLQIFKENGIKYVLTRTVGYNHIDLNTAKEFGMKVAYVPFYSPNAIAELAVSLSLMLARNTSYTVSKTHTGDYTIDALMFAKEIRKSTVGIIGLGKIGFTAAQLFKGLGAKVIGYDTMEKSYLGDVCTQVDLETLLRESDIISIHVPYIKGVNEKMVNKEFLSKVKADAIIVNTSRGELQEITDVMQAITDNKIKGYAADVLDNEMLYFNKKHDKPVDDIDEKIRALYPRLLVTPHIGSYTDEAVSNMVEFPYENLKEFIETGTSKNQLV